MVNWTQLPEELLLNVFGLLVPSDLLSVGSTCLLFFRLSKEKALWEALARKRWFLPQNFKGNKDSYIYLKTDESLEESLPLKIVSTDAQNYDDKYYTIKNLLKKSGRAYCTKNEYKNVNIVIELDADETEAFAIKSLELAAPSSFYSAPVDTAIVFVSYENPNIEETNQFNDMKEATFLQLAESYSILALQELRKPIGYFSCRGSSGISRIVFEPPVMGRYIHLKLLSAFETQENIDVMHFLAFGYIKDLKPKKRYYVLPYGHSQTS